MLTDALPVGCGQCIPCRVNRRRLWSSRQVLEARCHAGNSFVTFTYDDDHIDPEGNVDPKHLRYFLDRLRKRVGYRKLRYFAAGEYGDDTWRPHYHVNFFGLGPEFEEVMKECWGKGHIFVGDFNAHTAQYVAKYVVKKMTKVGDWRLDGRHPEFSRMSRNPGIGAPAIDVFLNSTNEYSAWDGLKMGSSPGAVKMDGRSLSLGRYLSNRFRDKAGFIPEYLEELKQVWVNEVTEEMRPLREAVRDGKALTTREALVRSKMGSIQSIEARHQLIKKGQL